VLAGRRNVRLIAANAIRHLSQQDREAAKGSERWRLRHHLADWQGGKDMIPVGFL
jgi:hypothetical protein